MPRRSAGHPAGLTPRPDPAPDAISPTSPPPTSIQISVPSRSSPRACAPSTTHDADFFLELLPGPRDRDGLPDSIRFWKTHIETTDPEKTFRVGLIYGPSGCGKSSLVKAGLLAPAGRARHPSAHRGNRR